jgi:hypothetical protein
MGVVGGMTEETGCCFRAGVCLSSKADKPEINRLCIFRVLRHPGHRYESLIIEFPSNRVTTGDLVNGVAFPSGGLLWWTDRSFRLEWLKIQSENRLGHQVGN